MLEGLTLASDPPDEGCVAEPARAPDEPSGEPADQPAAGVGIADFVYSRDAFVLLVWALGAAAVWYAARKPNKIDNPSPPPPPDPSPKQEPQVTMVRDMTHPNRWAVTRPSPWLTEPIERDENDDA